MAEEKEPTCVCIYLLPVLYFRILFSVGPSNVNTTACLHVNVCNDLISVIARVKSISMEKFQANRNGQQGKFTVEHFFLCQLSQFICLSLSLSPSLKHTHMRAHIHTHSLSLSIYIIKRSTMYKMYCLMPMI
ncbi:unnamed protein product [Xylocopa violacea]|uniref:Uncharacterized protein n=1 Tax=Xylocopa violacea TaxID=135666 RepID=A0ABP1P7N6_XYLVO